MQVSFVKNLISKLNNSPKMSHNFVGAPSFREQNPGYSFLNCYEADTYASIYPSIKAIANEFMTIRPYSINANGKPVESVAVNALYHPNQQDSSVAFFEKLAVMNLTHRKTYLLVWRREGNEAKPGGDITPQNIAGYTFLENPGITRRDGHTLYNVGSQEFSDQEVIVIPGGVDPYDLYGGYAPGEASRRWAKLDDYIADYQAGFFENGAVPAGQFIITAASGEDFNDIVDKMQARHRGAGKNNNVTYTPRPVDQATGKPVDAQVEWIPFASTNREIDFKNLFEQANKRIDSAFGVPASIRGVGENNNYATAQTDQQNFIRFTVSPLALRIYTQITHELNRITNGLGVAITYTLVLPAISDEQKTQAETKTLEVAALTSLITAGFSLDSTVDALRLSNSYKLLKQGAGKTEIDNDKPEVDEGGEVTESPDPEKIDGVTPLNKAAAKRTNPKAALTDQEKLEKAARKFLKSQINKAIDEVDPSDQGEFTQDQLETFVDEALIAITSMLVASGDLQHEEGIALLLAFGIDTENITAFKLTDDKLAAYRTYLLNVGNSYGSDTTTAIRAVLDRGAAEGLTANEIKKQLRGLTDLEEYRVTRLARTETARAGGNGSLYSMQQIDDETPATIYKVWNTTSSNPCPQCQALNGTRKRVGEAFLNNGEQLQLEDGGVFVNTFVDADIASVHPNDECVMTYEVER